MSKLSNLFLITLVAVAAIFSGCGTDNPVEPLGPSIALLPGIDAVTDSASVAPGDTFLVQINASQGDASLNRIEVREDGSPVDPSRLVFDGFAAQNNPNPVTATNELIWDIQIAANDMEGTYEYSIVITDENSNTAASTVTVTVVEPATPVNTRDMILLLNQGGPAGQGALDLETGDGMGTQAADTAADIRDQGIDTDLPVAQNWIQRIASINNTDLRAAAGTTTWDEIQTLEDISVAFNEGSRITDQSEVVEVGDLFLVESTTGTLYALLVTDVEITPSDNNDFYEFSVKGPE